jgi:hypothetical protein
MAEWCLAGADVYGCVVAIDFAASTWRAVTSDHQLYLPVGRGCYLHDPLSSVNDGRRPGR